MNREFNSGGGIVFFGNTNYIFFARNAVAAGPYAGPTTCSRMLRPAPALGPAGPIVNSTYFFAFSGTSKHHDAAICMRYDTFM